MELRLEGSESVTCPEHSFAEFIVDMLAQLESRATDHYSNRWVNRFAWVGYQKANLLPPLNDRGRIGPKLESSPFKSVGRLTSLKDRSLVNTAQLDESRPFAQLDLEHNRG